MDEYEALAFALELNETIKHSPQRCDRPPAITGLTVSDLRDLAGAPTGSVLVWVVASGQAYRFSYRLAQFGAEKVLSLDYLATVDASLSGGLHQIGFREVPGNVSDLAFTAAAYRLHIPSGHSP